MNQLVRFVQSRNLFVKGSSVYGLVRVFGSIITGLFASLVDLAVLTTLVELFHFSPTHANVPSLIAGSSIQFFGNRRYVFINAARGRLLQQMAGFIITELISLGLNGLGFYAVVKWTPLHYTVARCSVAAIVFIGFSYPSWSLIFRTSAGLASNKKVFPNLKACPLKVILFAKKPWAKK